MSERPSAERCVELGLEQAKEQLKFEPTIDDATQEIQTHMESIAGGNWCYGLETHGIEEIYVLEELLSLDLAITELRKREWQPIDSMPADGCMYPVFCVDGSLDLAINDGDGNYDSPLSGRLHASRKPVKWFPMPQPDEPERKNCKACHKCVEVFDVRDGGLPLNATRMLLCPECGNKRCPKASDHELNCTGSNEPGQQGSVYGGE